MTEQTANTLENLALDTYPDMDEYNGWTNHDTWNAYNFCSEDEGIYHFLKDSLNQRELSQRFFMVFGFNERDIEARNVNFTELLTALHADNQQAR